MTLSTILHPLSHMTGITGIMCPGMQALYTGAIAAGTAAEPTEAADTGV